MQLLLPVLLWLNTKALGVSFHIATRSSRNAVTNHECGAPSRRPLPRGISCHRGGQNSLIRFPQSNDDESPDGHRVCAVSSTRAWLPSGLCKQQPYVGSILDHHTAPFDHEGPGCATHAAKHQHDQPGRAASITAAKHSLQLYD